MNQVITVFKSRSLKLHTTRSWDFLGLTVDNAGHTPPPQLAYGSDVIVGIFDTGLVSISGSSLFQSSLNVKICNFRLGIWPESESFREPPEAKPIPSSWKGKCVGGGDVRCNRKLIGARFYLKGFEEAYGELNRTRDREYRSPRDRLGHGTHTASTAVGSVVSNVSGFAGGVARGGAPSARLAVYKTCWGKDLEGVCTEADILAAFDDAVRDGVDVISASFGSSPPLAAFFESSADIGGFHAAERGISVVFSGGNDGPDPGLVQNVAPWAVSVAASTMDRSFPTNIVIDGGYTLTGQSLVSQEITGTLALATTYFDGGVCKWENWLKKLATETIILCFSTLGPVQFIEEAQAAAIRANASALIFAASPTKQLVEEVDVIPTVRVDILSGTRIRNYLARSPTVPVVKVGPSKTVIGEITAPSVAYFSSRGPSSLSPDILKPDITAPGIGILGAWPPKTPPTLLPGDHRSVEWNFQSGTSMSCPHVAGVMALVQSAHPDWSPSAIRSAIMTTAGTRDTSNDLILSGGSMKPTDPFDIGAGHINPLKAMYPGLVYNTKTEDYVLFLCNIGYTDQQIKSMLLLHSESSTTCLPSHSCRTNADFNYPSITIPSLRSTRTIKRTVSNVGPNKNTVYFVDIVRPVGVEVKIWPRILVFSNCQQEHSLVSTWITSVIDPDDLLLRILSLNTTKGVLATSLLSKRWRYLWTLVPGLKYDDINHNGDYKLFKQFVHRSFLSNKAPVLEHLHLSLGRDCPSVDIGLWINLALSRHVRVLHIVIPYPKKGPVTLPSSLYTSEKLQRLTLIKCVFLDVPVHVRLPSLKTLSLKLITYADNTSLQRLLSGCPNLEGLSVVVEQCIGDPPVDVNIVMPSLQRLHMSHANIETRGTYVIDVPSLKCLEISDSARCNFRQIENMPELLAIYFSGMDIPTGWKPPSSVPECLLHSLEAFEWFEYKGRQVDREMAKYVLKNALRLKTATFSNRSTDMGDKCQMLKELESDLLDPLLLILDSAQNSSDNSQTVNHPPLLAVLVSSYHLRRRATSKQTTMTAYRNSPFQASVYCFAEYPVYLRNAPETDTIINCLLLDVPAHVLIPSLKTLSLKFVTCSVTDKTSLQRILSGCPNLEELSVEQDLIDFNIVAPSLQRLHMSQQSFESRRLYVLDAPSLKYLKISDTVSWNLRQIENMPELVRAHVNIWGGDSTQRFLKALTSVRHLTLSMTTPKELGICLSGIDIPIGWKQPSSVPKCLLHSLEAFEWFGYRGRQGEREMATYVLKNATCLKTETFSPLSTDLGEKYQMLKELASVATASASCQLLFD
ncbi:hypothetical protein Bca4012_080392 [Brassica carinata]